AAVAAAHRCARPAPRLLVAGGGLPRHAGSVHDLLRRHRLDHIGLLHRDRRCRAGAGERDPRRRVLDRPGRDRVRTGDPGAAGRRRQGGGDRVQAAGDAPRPGPEPGCGVHRHRRGVGGRHRRDRRGRGRGGVHPRDSARPGGDRGRPGHGDRGHRRRLRGGQGAGLRDHVPPGGAARGAVRRQSVRERGLADRHQRHRQPEGLGSGVMTAPPRPLSDARRRVVLVAGWVLVLLVALLLAGYLSGGWDWYGGYTLLVTALAAVSLGAGTSRVPTRWPLVRYAAFPGAPRVTRGTAGTATYGPGTAPRESAARGSAARGRPAMPTRAASGRSRSRAVVSRPYW